MEVAVQLTAVEIMSQSSRSILPRSEPGPVDLSGASFWEAGAGLVCLALSYQPLCLCIQSVSAPTSAFSDGRHCFSSGFKDRSLKALLPSVLLDNC